jgi:hypothetical protein
VHLTANQRAIVNDLRTRAKKRGTMTLVEADDLYDGRSFWPLVQRGVIRIKHNCGCGVPCGCTSLVKLVENG